MSDATQPLVVQRDHTILLEVQHPGYEAARDRLARFAELQKSPEFVHFYKVTPISIWNAAALGEPLESIVAFLNDASRYPVDDGVLGDLRDWYGRYGKLRLRAAGDDAIVLESDDPALLARLCEHRTVAPLLDGATVQKQRVAVPIAQRGELKQALVRLGHPVLDLAGYRAGTTLRFAFRDGDGVGAFRLRSYQTAAAAAFHAGGTEQGGNGVVVLPCGAGKTVVAMEAMRLLQTGTLVLTTNTVAVRQWQRELLAKTTLTADEVGEYTGERKEIRPVTIATYQILTHRRRRNEALVHFDLFERREFGLVVYDEVHLLPAPVFRMTAGIQARRRLGLTATLVREDGQEHAVFSLIGPKRFELQWRELERQGFLATASCVELRVPMSADLRQRYQSAGARQRFQIASRNPRKLDVVAELLARHDGAQTLVIGQFLDQLHEVATRLQLPLVTGRTPTAERERLYAEFRAGTIRRLAISKVGNFAIDLPDASVAIQVSGTFGSRQEEAQRLGRILRPKQDGGGAVFYSVVSESSCEQEFSAKRQLFLSEQGYSYRIEAAATARGADEERA